MRVLLIDNYDSFTFNLVHEFGVAGALVEVVRNDKIRVDDIASDKPQAIVISPGPSTPSEAGISLEIVERLSELVPIMGVCLGHQTIGQAFGGKVVRAPKPVHGKTSRIDHEGRGLFRGLNGPFEATRYHSLVVERSTLPGELEITAEADGLIMGLSHRTRPVHGVQFHPESIASQNGQRIIMTFLELAKAFHGARA
jgi:anthranilate synthase component II